MKFVDPKVFLVGETRIVEDGLQGYLDHVGAPSWNTNAPSDAEKLCEVMGRLCYRSFEPGLNPNVTRVRQGNDVYLGNIVETYQRPDLAMNILDPNKTIAQGFASNLVTMKDGTSLMGFVTDEQGEQVTLRDIASQEHTFKKADIAKRETLPMSLMPPGLMANFSVHEMASLLDYLASLVKK